MGMLVTIHMKKVCKTGVMIAMLAGLASVLGTPLLALTGADFLRLESSPNAAVMMGGAALSGTPAMLAVNPASLLGQQEPSISFSHFASFALTGYEQLEGVIPLGSHLAVGGRLFYDSAYGLADIDLEGNNQGTIANYDLLVNPAMAVKINELLNLGVGLKGFQSVLFDYSSVGAALDMGVHFQVPGLGLSLGASMQNLGFMTAYNTVQEQLPLSFDLGAAYQWLSGPHQFTVLGDVTTVVEEYQTLTPILGAVYRYGGLASVRVAYRLDQELGNLMVGAGLTWQAIGVAYAYQPLGALGDNHRFSVSYLFK